MKKIIKNIKSIIEQYDVKQITVTWKHLADTARPEIIIKKYSQFEVCVLCKGKTNTLDSSHVPCPACQGKGILKT